MQLFAGEVQILELLPLSGQIGGGKKHVVYTLTGGLIMNEKS